jgi:hypothetical protein
MAREVKQQGKKRINLGRVLLLVLIAWVGFSFANAAANLQAEAGDRGFRKRIIVLEMRKEDLEREIEEWKSPENVETGGQGTAGAGKTG